MEVDPEEHAIGAFGFRDCWDAPTDRRQEVSEFEDEPEVETVRGWLATGKAECLSILSLSFWRGAGSIAQALDHGRQAF